MPERNNNGVVWAGVAVALVLGYKYVIKPGIVEPAKLKSYTQRIRVNMPAVRFKGDNVELDMYIQNPNPNPITIEAVVGDAFISYQGKALKMGNIDRYGPVVIKPLAETKYTFSIRLKLIPLIAYFNDILAGKAKGQVASFIGTITINGKPWPIKEVVKLS